MQHATLSDGFEGWTPQDAVHSLPQEVAVAQLRCHVKGQLPQLAVIGVRHAGEADAKPERRRKVLSQLLESTQLCYSILIFSKVTQVPLKQYSKFLTLLNVLVSLALVLASTTTA